MLLGRTHVRLRWVCLNPFLSLSSFASFSFSLSLFLCFFLFCLRFLFSSPKAELCFQNHFFFFSLSILLQKGRKEKEGRQVIGNFTSFRTVRIPSFPSFYELSQFSYFLLTSTLIPSFLLTSFLFFLFS